MKQKPKKRVVRKPSYRPLPLRLATRHAFYLGLSRYVLEQTWPALFQSLRVRKVKKTEIAERLGTSAGPITRISDNTRPSKIAWARMVASMYGSRTWWTEFRPEPDDKSESATFWTSERRLTCRQYGVVYALARIRGAKDESIHRQFEVLLQEIRHISAIWSNVHWVTARKDVAKRSILLKPIAIKLNTTLEALDELEHKWSKACIILSQIMPSALDTLND